MTAPPIVSQAGDGDAEGDLNPIAERDREAQAIVLDLLLSEHPTQLTVGEITLALAADPSFAERDRIEEAIRELVRAGLVRRQMGAVIPTRATLRLGELVSYWA